MGIRKPLILQVQGNATGGLVAVCASSEKLSKYHNLMKTRDKIGNEHGT